MNASHIVCKGGVVSIESFISPLHTSTSTHLSISFCSPIPPYTSLTHPPITHHMSSIEYVYQLICQHSSIYPLSSHPFIHLYTHPPIYHTFIHTPHRLSIFHLSTYLSTYLPTHSPFSCLFIHSLNLPIYITTHPSSTHESIYRSNPRPATFPLSQGAWSSWRGAKHMVNYLAGIAFFPRNL